MIPFTLKSVQFMIGAFLRIVGGRSISGVMEECFSFAIVEFVTFEFSLALTVKYESKACTVGLLNIIFLLTISTAIVSMKSLVHINT